MKLESDDLVNQPVEDLVFDIRSQEDFQKLRRAWTTLPKIPKLVDGPACPIILESGGQVIRTLLRGEESAGALMVAYVTMAPGGGGAPNHHQPLEDEFWFCVQGEWEWKIGNLERRVGPGAFAYAPRNTTHSFRNVGDTEAAMFTVNTPAGHERGFQAAHKLLAEKAPASAIRESFKRHDFIFHEA